MKIGILTLTLRDNYGGVLQAYALQTILRQMGHQPILLARVRSVDSSIISLIFRIISFIKCLFRVYILKSNQWRVMNPFNSNYSPKKELDSFVETPLKHFIKTHFVQTPFLYTSKSLFKEIEQHEIECIIVGSDQVWREEYSPCITDYFLTFLPENYPLLGIAYAASFGKEQIDSSSKSLLLCKRAITRFKAVSVRESSAVKILQNYFDISAEIVLDPTLLLYQADYNKLIQEENQSSKCTGVVSYILDITEDKQCIVNHIRTKFPKITNYTKMEMFSNYGQSEHAIVPTMGQWLNTIKNADFIVTDSFHGCVFSILFKKQFVAIANMDRGIDRFHTLFERLGIRHRIVFNFSEYLEHIDDIYAVIDYDAVYERLEFNRKQSMHFLVSALKG